MVPGSSFNVGYTDHFRMTLLPDVETMSEVFVRIERLLDHWPKPLKSVDRDARRLTRCRCSDARLERFERLIDDRDLLVVGAAGGERLGRLEAAPAYQPNERRCRGAEAVRIARAADPPHEIQHAPSITTHGALGRHDLACLAEHLDRLSFFDRHPNLIEM